MWEEELRPYYLELLQNEYALNWQSKMNMDTYWMIMDQCFPFVDKDRHIYECVLQYYNGMIRNKFATDIIEFGVLITFHLIVEKAVKEYNRQLQCYKQQMRSIFQIDVLMDEDDDDNDDHDDDAEKIN